MSTTETTKTSSVEIKLDTVTVAAGNGGPPIEPEVKTVEVKSEANSVEPEVNSVEPEVKREIKTKVTLPRLHPKAFFAKLNPVFYDTNGRAYYSMIKGKDAILPFSKMNPHKIRLPAYFTKTAINLPDTTYLFWIVDEKYGNIPENSSTVTVDNDAKTSLQLLKTSANLYSGRHKTGWAFIDISPDLVSSVRGVPPL